MDFRDAFRSPDAATEGTTVEAEAATRNRFSLSKLFGGARAEPEETATVAGAEVEIVERDVEAPEVFQATEAGLWDGRPSLGGVWVAHPDVTDPERVLIRNASNDEFVVGALFRRERDIPGPRLQVSSDAAQALGMLAGAPAKLNVTALRKEQVEIAPAVVPLPEEATVEAAELEAAPVETAALDPVATAAAAVLDPAPSAAVATDAVAAAPAAPVPAPAAPAGRASPLAKPYLQIGIFSVEANANRTANMMRSAGMIPSIKKGSRGGKPFWRVVVGPAQTTGERGDLMAKIREVGFTDAYPVTN